MALLTAGLRALTGFSASGSMAHGNALAASSAGEFKPPAGSHSSQVVSLSSSHPGRAAGLGCQMSGLIEAGSVVPHALLASSESTGAEATDAVGKSVHIVSALGVDRVRLHLRPWCFWRGDETRDAATKRVDLHRERWRPDGSKRQAGGRGNVCGVPASDDPPTCLLEGSGQDASCRGRRRLKEYLR